MIHGYNLMRSHLHLTRCESSARIEPSRRTSHCRPCTPRKSNASLTSNGQSCSRSLGSVNCASLGTEGSVNSTSGAAYTTPFGGTLDGEVHTSGDMDDDDSGSRGASAADLDAAGPGVHADGGSALWKTCARRDRSSAADVMYWSMRRTWSRSLSAMPGTKLSVDSRLESRSASASRMLRTWRYDQWERGDWITPPSRWPTPARWCSWCQKVGGKTYDGGADGLDVCCWDGG